MKKTKRSIPNNAIIVLFKSGYFRNLNEKNTNDNKTFWKTTIDKKRLLWVTIILLKLHTFLSTFFSNIASNLNNAEYLNCEPLANNASNPV